MPCIDVQENPRFTVAKVTCPDLGENHIHSIAEKLVQLAAQVGEGELRVDLDDVGYVGSTALGKFVSLHKQLDRQGGGLILENVSPFVCEIFTLTRLNTILDVRCKDDDLIPA